MLVLPYDISGSVRHKHQLRGSARAVSTLSLKANDDTGHGHDGKAKPIFSHTARFGTDLKHILQTPIDDDLGHGRVIGQR